MRGRDRTASSKLARNMFSGVKEWSDGRTVVVGPEESGVAFTCHPSYRCTLGTTDDAEPRWDVATQAAAAARLRMERMSRSDELKSE